MPSEAVIYQDSFCIDSQTHLKAAAKNAYNEQRKEFAIDDQQITQFIPMVHKIVQKVAVYLKPPLSYEDLVSVGTIGLVKAARDYDPSHKAEFKTYAYIRIRGAILDELRDSSFVPAGVNKQIQEAEKLTAESIDQTGHTPTDEELAQKLDIPVTKLYRMFENARAKKFISLDSSSEHAVSLKSTLESSDATAPFRQLEKKELIDKLAQAITGLNEKQRHLIVLYYQQDLTMKQIAEVFGVTEPRVSQIHASALFNLSVKIKQWKDDK